jgi:hypothetical protein
MQRACTRTTGLTQFTDSLSGAVAIVWAVRGSGQFAGWHGGVGVGVSWTRVRIRVAAASGLDRWVGRRRFVDNSQERAPAR